MPGKVVKILVKEGECGAVLYRAPHPFCMICVISLTFVTFFLPPPPHILNISGDTVASGQALFILEAMKMEHSVKATFTGTVTKVHSRVGDLVEDGRVLITCEGK